MIAANTAEIGIVKTQAHNKLTVIPQRTPTRITITLLSSILFSIMERRFYYLCSFPQKHFIIVSLC